MSVDPSKLDVTLMVDANERYMPVGNVVIPVENTSEQVMFRAKPPSSRSSDTVTFDIDTDGNFLGRDIQILWDNIPLKCTLDGTAVTYTTTDFHNSFFNNYKDLVMSPFGMLAGISSINVNIDGKNFQTADVSTIMESISHYYSPDELARYFDASNHNIYYSNLVDESNPWIPSVTTDNQKVLIKASSLSQNDPFSATVDDRFNSRVPVFTCSAAAATATKDINVRLHGLSTWLPFNLLGISGDSSPLYHANNVKLTVTFHSNWVNRIFQTRRKPLAAAGDPVAMYKFALDTTATSASSGDLRCCFKTFAAPQYIKSTMNATQDRYLQSYSLIEHDTKTTPIVFGAGDTSKDINSADFNLRAIPKSIIVSVVNKRSKDEEYLTDPAHFARIDSLTVELAGKVTEIATGNGADQLYTICKSNGLELNKTQALYTFGFPVRLNISDNLTCPSNTYVGYSAFGDKGSITLRLRGKCTRLHHHTENGKFKVPSATATPAITDDEVFKRYAKEYELRVTIIYASYFAYRMTGSKFDVIESLSASTLDSLKSHTNLLKVSYAPKMNTLGGSWITSLLPTLKDIGKGAYNIVRDVISNKNGIRDKLVDSYKGAGFDNHMPLSGGAFPMQSNITAGRSIDGWDTF